MPSKFERQTEVVNEASRIESYKEKLFFLKSNDEFKNLKDSSALDKLRRWSIKIQSDHKSEYRGCTYGNFVDNLVACDIKNLLSTLKCPNNKKMNCSIINIDVLEELLLRHCRNNGKMSEYNKMKRCKGWAMDFCRRHSFNTTIITVVGSSRSKANNSRFSKSQYRSSGSEIAVSGNSAAGISTKSTLANTPMSKIVKCIDLFPLSDVAVGLLNLKNVVCLFLHLFVH
jgi:hypothetical protein